MRIIGIRSKGGVASSFETDDSHEKCDFERLCDADQIVVFKKCKTANLLEGKVIVLCDGTPFALITPAVFTQFYHSPERRRRR
ncbi:spore germination protein [Paenibacillus sp. PvR148]